jgi:5'/3'-nucleotidase SurE
LNRLLPPGSPRSIIVWLLLAVGIAGPASAQDAECEASTLNILLTNDDGYDTPGIVALHRALTAAGHRVKRVAPAENQSGSSASLSLSDVIVTHVPDEEFSDVYAVTTTPATTVLLGGTTLFPPEQQLHLVVSGINEGANLGPATPISGTVGAVIAGLRLLQPQVPGIAVSTNPLNDEPRSAENLALLERIGSFVARLIGRLQEGACGRNSLLPPNTALNVNYPPLAPAQIRGVRLASQGRAPYFRLSFQALEGGLHVPSFGSPELAEDSPDADTRLFNEGWVTVVPLDGDYTAPGSTVTGEFLKALAP